MKKIIFSLAMLLVAGFTFAQEKNVKEAKSILNEVKPDFAKAEKLIEAALTNPETKDNAETWNVAGQIQKKRSEKQISEIYEERVMNTVYQICEIAATVIETAILLEFINRLLGSKES